MTEIEAKAHFYALGEKLLRDEIAKSEPLEAHELATLFPLLQDSPLEQLREDIKVHGIRKPIVLYDGKILDGRNRYACARALGIDCPVTVYNEGDPLGFVVSLNLHRRHLTESQRAMVAGNLANMGQGSRTDLEPRANLHEVSTADAADLLNVSERSVKSGRKVRDKGDDSLIDAVESGQVSVSAAADVAELLKPEQAEIVARGEKEILTAAKEIRQKKAAKRREENKQTAAKKAPTPVGQYDTIVMDPPWPMQKVERDARPNQVGFDYPTMSEAELADLSIPAADNCHVWVWTTHKFLPMALRLLDNWSLKYVCTFVWHKSGGFQPFGLPQYNAEFALYARHGSPKFVETKAFPTCFSAPRGAHSEKPQEFYDMVSRVTDGRRLDMFNRRNIDGFDGWGNESA